MALSDSQAPTGQEKTEQKLQYQRNLKERDYFQWRKDAEFELKEIWGDIAEKRINRVRPGYKILCGQAFFSRLICQYIWASYNKIQKMARNNKEKLDTKKSNKPLYKKYSYDARVKLINLVRFQKKRVSKVAKQLGICPTTARLILSTWDEEGRVFEKKNQKDRRLRREREKSAKEERKNQLKEKQRLRRMKRKEREVDNNIKVQALEEENNIIENIAPLEIKEEAAVPQVPYYQSQQIPSCYNEPMYYYMPYVMPNMYYY